MTEIAAQERFIVYTSSDEYSSPGHVPNTYYAWRQNFPRNIRLEGEWDVALLDASIPTRPMSLLEKINYPHEDPLMDKLVWVKTNLKPDPATKRDNAFSKLGAGWFFYDLGDRSSEVFPPFSLHQLLHNLSQQLIFVDEEGHSYTILQTHYSGGDSKRNGFMEVVVDQRFSVYVYKDLAARMGVKNKTKTYLGDYAGHTKQWVRLLPVQVFDNVDLIGINLERHASEDNDNRHLWLWDGTSWAMIDILWGLRSYRLVGPWSLLDFWGVLRDRIMRLRNPELRDVIQIRTVGEDMTVDIKPGYELTMTHDVLSRSGLPPDLILPFQPHAGTRPNGIPVSTRNLETIRFKSALIENASTRFIDVWPPSPRAEPSITKSQDKLEAIYIYCDVIDPHPVGNVNSKVLRVVEVTPGKRYRSSYINLHWNRLLIKDFGALHFELHDPKGNFLPEVVDGVTRLTLEFRRIK